ncbi:hypothetical protein VNO78_09945 [Psophocarpus tetragonolobus]|uniref:Uncharacterized protein n=1 Tax=Psophocarpus tetragonolobus TaxID=3891 RepID=A0AAN9SQH0_PSOTE
MVVHLHRATGQIGVAATSVRDAIPSTAATTSDPSSTMGYASSFEYSLCTAMDSGVQGCILATLILHDEEIPVTSEKINALLKSAKVSAKDYNEAKNYIEDIKDICDDFEGLYQRNVKIWNYNGEFVNNSSAFINESWVFKEDCIRDETHASSRKKSQLCCGYDQSTRRSMRAPPEDLIKFLDNGVAEHSNCLIEPSVLHGA